jgi:hypothetical protein
MDLVLDQEQSMTMNPMTDHVPSSSLDNRWATSVEIAGTTYWSGREYDPYAVLWRSKWERGYTRTQTAF